MIQINAQQFDAPAVRDRATWMIGERLASGRRCVADLDLA